MATAEAETAEPLFVGRRLRPVVFGGGRHTPNRFAPGAPDHSPELVLAVHARDGQQLGYVVLDRPVRTDTWGGMTVTDTLSIGHAIALAQATTGQLCLFGLPHGSHHCIAVLPRGSGSPDRTRRRREYIDALGPLAEAGLCRIVFTCDSGALRPRLAEEGLAASLVATTLAALDWRDQDPSRATVAVDPLTPNSERVAAALADQGLRPIDQDRSSGKRADVLVLGGPSRPVYVPKDAALEAQVIVTLGASVPRSLQHQLHERGVLFVPAALAAAGVMLALDFRSRGMDERSAVRRTFQTVDRQARALLGDADAADESLASAVQGSISAYTADASANQAPLSARASV